MEPSENNKRKKKRDKKMEYKHQNTFTPVKGTAQLREERPFPRNADFKDKQIAFEENKEDTLFSTSWAMFSIKEALLV